MCVCVSRHLDCATTPRPLDPTSSIYLKTERTGAEPKHFMCTSGTMGPPFTHNSALVANAFYFKHISQRNIYTKFFYVFFMKNT